MFRCGNVVRSTLCPDSVQIQAICQIQYYTGRVAAEVNRPSIHWETKHRVDRLRGHFLSTFTPALGKEALDPKIVPEFEYTLIYQLHLTTTTCLQTAYISCTQMQHTPMQQDRQCTYNTTLWRVRATFLLWKSSKY
jgi:hypothetical protein